MRALLISSKGMVPTFCVLAGLSLLHGVAMAENDNPFSLLGSLSIQNDSNLFRQSALASNSASDQITTATVGLGFRSQQSLQSFAVNLSVVNAAYQNFSYLNYSATNYDAQWQFAATPHLLGTLTAVRQESLNSYANTQNNSVRYIDVNQSSGIQAMYGADGPWGVSAGLTQAVQSSQRDQALGSNFSSVTSDFGLHRQFSSGSKVSLISRFSSGQYQNPPAFANSLFDNEFSQLDTEARLHWALSAINTVDLHAAQRTISHPHVSFRDYAGTVAGAETNWVLTGQTVLAAAWFRKLDTYQTLDANYTQTDGISFGVNWQIRPKVSLSLHQDLATVQYLGGPFAFLQSQRQDKLSNTAFALVWTPRQQCTVSASIQNSLRESNLLGLDYASTLTSLTAQVNF